MQSLWIIGSCLAGFLAGAALAWSFWRGRAADLAAAARNEAAAASATLAERLKLREEQLAAATRLTADRDQALREAAAATASLQAKLAETIARHETEQRQAAEKLKLLDDAKRQLADQFKLLAGEILEAKGKQFAQASGEQLDAILKPLRERLADFAKKVEDTHEKDVRDRAAIKQLIELLDQNNRALGAQAEHLAKALHGDVKAQGNWGELVLERVLDASGLEPGLAYEVQESHPGPDGRRFQPDVVVKLPDGKRLVIDAKVSLVAYERYLAEDTDAGRERALKEHAQSLRNHIKGLGDKSYQSIPGLATPDFVFLFIPIEMAYTLALRGDPGLLEEAARRRLVMVTPGTLLSALFLVNYLWQQEKRSRSADAIADLAGKLYDKLADAVAAFIGIGKRLEQAQQDYDQAIKRLATGRGNALGIAEKIRAMGVRTTKSLPAEFATPDDLPELPGPNDTPLPPDSATGPKTQDA